MADFSLLAEETMPGPASLQLTWLIIGLLSVPALVILNGFFVAAEFALVAVRKTRVEEMVQQKLFQAKAVQEAVGNLDRSIAATQLGITLASLALGWVSEPALVRLVEPLLERILPQGLLMTLSHSVAVALAFSLITFMHVVFGELIPKTLALQSPDRTSLRIAAPLMLFTRLARPFIALINGTGNGILRLFGYSPSGVEGLVHSVEELRLLVNQSEEAGILSATQSEYARKVFRLSGKQVRDCMVPRSAIVALEVSMPAEEALALARQSLHTRMPIYEGTLDNVVGVVNTKDLFGRFSLGKSAVLTEILYPPLFLKPEADVADALQLFRSQRKFLAVVKEQGIVLGLITMEDILEEIVGDIEDEHDAPGSEAPGRRR